MGTRIGDLFREQNKVCFLRDQLKGSPAPTHFSLAHPLSHPLTTLIVVEPILDQFHELAVRDNDSLSSLTWLARPRSLSALLF